MKTTLTLDDDVADFLRERSRLQDKPFEWVVNDTLRRGLEMFALSKSDADGGKDAKPKPFKVIPFSSGFKPGVDPNNPKRFLDELDVEDYLRKERNFRKDLNDRS